MNLIATAGLLHLEPLLAATAGGYTVCFWAISIGVLSTYWSRNDLRLAWRSRRWPTVPGHVVEKRELKGICATIAGDGTSAPTTRKWREIEIVYTYKVDGVAYTSNRLDFSGYGWWGSKFYKDGARVVVHYDPVSPSMAVLRPGIHLDMLWAQVIAVAGIAVALYL